MRQPAQRRAYPWQIVMSRTTALTGRRASVYEGRAKQINVAKSEPRSRILTDTPVNNALEAEAAKVRRTTGRMMARTLVPKKELKPAKRQKDTERETCQCLVCDEPFDNSRPGEKWMSCTDCGKWVHEDCTSRDRCYVCHNDCESN